MNLPIDIGFGNVIEINQGQGSDSMAGQGFGCPGTHPADTHDGHVRLTQCSISFQAKQAHKSAKATLCLADVIDVNIRLNCCLNVMHYISCGLLNDAFLHDPEKKLSFSLDKSPPEEHNLYLTP
jgi:hypothetical protein